jgi:hypothetical protein
MQQETGIIVSSVSHHYTFSIIYLLWSVQKAEGYIVTSWNSWWLSFCGRVSFYQSYFLVSSLHSSCIMMLHNFSSCTVTLHVAYRWCFCSSSSMTRNAQYNFSNCRWQSTQTQMPHQMPQLKSHAMLLPRPKGYVFNFYTHIQNSSNCLWQWLNSYLSIILLRMLCQRYVWYTQHGRSWFYSCFQVTLYCMMCSWWTQLFGG